MDHEKEGEGHVRTHCEEEGLFLRDAWMAHRGGKETMLGNNNQPQWLLGKAWTAQRGGGEKCLKRTGWMDGAAWRTGKTVERNHLSKSVG